MMTEANANHPDTIRTKGCNGSLSAFSPLQTFSRFTMLLALPVALPIACTLMAATINAAQAEPSKNAHANQNQNQNADAMATYTYADKQNGYSIDFPSDWKTKTDPIVNLVATPAAQIKEANSFPNVKVVARSLPSGETLDTICDKSMRQWATLWQVQSDQRSQKGRTPTRRLVLMQIIPQVNLKTKVLKAFAVSGDNYYIISCADKPEHFEESKKTFEAIIDSLKLVVK
ncbi:MAG: PsbP-related protein [Candidatus Melainabacteria bacterium]|nr:PsbP-related protein [Candidatus Melainabacteria bacterium]